MTQHKIDDLIAYGAFGAVAAVVFVLIGLLAMEGRQVNGQAGTQSAGSVMNYLFNHPKG